MNKILSDNKMSELSIEQQEAIRSAELGGLKKKLNAASWSDHMENLMKSWGEKAAGLRWMHNNAAGSWKGFSDKLALTGIALTTISSAAAFGGAGAENEQVVMYVLGGMGLAASLVQSLKKFYQADEKVYLYNLANKSTTKVSTTDTHIKRAPK